MFPFHSTCTMHIITFPPWSNSFQFPHAYSYLSLPQVIPFIQKNTLQNSSLPTLLSFRPHAFSYLSLAKLYPFHSTCIFIPFPRWIVQYPFYSTCFFIPFHRWNVSFLLHMHFLTFPSLKCSFPFTYIFLPFPPGDVSFPFHMHCYTFPSLNCIISFPLHMHFLTFPSLKCCLSTQNWRPSTLVTKPSL